MPTLRPILAFDLGSYCTRGVRLRKSDRLEERTMLALRRREPGGPQNIIAIGEESLAAAAELGAGTEIVRPIDGAIQDYIVCEAMLRFFTRRLLPTVLFLKPLVLTSIVTGLSEVERRAAYDAMTSGSNGYAVFLVEDALAVASAAGLVMSDKPTLILQIGAGAASVGVWDAGGLSHTRHWPLAGNHLDLLIRRRIWDELGRRVDLETCRSLKQAVGAVGGASSARFTGSSILNDEAGDRLDPEQLTPVVVRALEAGLGQLSGEVQWFLRELPDDVQRGLDWTRVLLAGGTAKLPGIATWLSDRLGRDVKLLDEPDEAVIKGLQIIAVDFEAKGWFRRLARGRDAGAPNGRNLNGWTRS